MDATVLLERWTGKKSVSPSFLTAWSDNRAQWVLSYLYGHREPTNAAMVRGKAVEAGVEALLHGFPIDDAQQKAADLWLLEIEGVQGEGIETERENVAPMVAQGELAIKDRNLPRPVATQLRCEAWIDGERFSLPLAGYADFVFDGWTLDCKTTKACPSSPKPLHVAQVACYAKARGEDHAGLLYLTPKKWAVLPVESEDIERAWRELAIIARSLLSTLYVARDREHMAAMFCPPLDHFSWPPERRETFRQIVGASV